MPAFCTSGQAILKAGAGMNTDFLTAGKETDINDLISQATAFINVAAKKNFNTDYNSLNPDVKIILRDTASSHAGIALINYDMSGYTSRAEAQTMIDVNYTRVVDNIRLLKEKDYSHFISL